jgi:hypothetical protein
MKAAPSPTPVFRSKDRRCFFSVEVDKASRKYYVEHMKQAATYTIFNGTTTTTFPTTCPTGDT